MERKHNSLHFFCFILELTWKNYFWEVQFNKSVKIQIFSVVFGQKCYPYSWIHHIAIFSNLSQVSSYCICNYTPKVKLLFSNCLIFLMCCIFKMWDFYCNLEITWSYYIERTIASLLDFAISLIFMIYVFSLIVLVSIVMPTSSRVFSMFGVGISRGILTYFDAWSLVLDLGLFLLVFFFAQEYRGFCGMVPYI